MYKHVILLWHRFAVLLLIILMDVKSETESNNLLILSKLGESIHFGYVEIHVQASHRSYNLCVIILFSHRYVFYLQRRQHQLNDR